MNSKRAKFVSEYLKDFNASQAAARAGYSAHTAPAQGGRLLQFVEVQDAIAKAVEESRQGSIMTLAEAQEIASTIGRDPEAPRRDRLAALDRLAKFNAWDAASKVDVTSGGQPLRTEIAFVATSAGQAEEAPDA